MLPIVKSCLDPGKIWLWREWYIRCEFAERCEPCSGIQEDFLTAGDQFEADRPPYISLPNRMDDSVGSLDTWRCGVTGLSRRYSRYTRLTRVHKQREHRVQKEVPTGSEGNVPGYLQDFGRQIFFRRRDIEWCRKNARK